MQFHKYIGSTGYEMIDFYDGDDWEMLLRLNGKPQARHWTPLRVRRVRPTRREGCRASDSPYYGTHLLIFRRSAVDALRDMLDAHGELLPLKDDDGVELFAYNPRALEALDQELTALARQSGEAPEIRVAAISALVARNPKLPEDAFNFLLGVLQNEREPGLRMAAAQSLGQAELSDAQLLPVAQQTVAQGDSLTLSPLLEAFRNTKDDRVGDALIVALRNPKVNLEAIGGKRIEQLFQHFSARTRQAATGILAQFQSEEAARVARLRQLEPLLTAGGDTGSGRNIFFGKRAACASCHTIGREGGHVGPDLTSIGAIRSGHDILEAIVFPSATMVPGHESRRVETKAGKVYTGVVSEFESDRTAVVLVMGPNDKVRIPRDDIASLTASTVSLMPDGFATQLTQKELTDLLAFLKAQK